MKKINADLGFIGAPGLNVYSNADGDVAYKTIKQTLTYYAVPVIVRGKSQFGTRLTQGTRLIGKVAPEKISVVDSNGGNAAAYYFFVTQMDGKQVYVIVDDLQRDFTNSTLYTVKGTNTYAYLPEMWINKKYRATDLPYGYSFSGTPMSVKTVTSGYNTVNEKYIKVNGENQYVPADNAVTESQFEIASISTNPDNASTGTVTEYINPKQKLLSEAGEAALGGSKTELTDNITDDRNVILKLYQNPDGSMRWLPITGTLAGIVVVGIFIRGLLK